MTPSPSHNELTHWGRETHICISKLTIIGSDNGLSPGRHQAIIWTNARILLIGPLGTNFSEILIKIHTFSFKKMRLKMSSAKWRPFCIGLNELNGRLFLKDLKVVDRSPIWNEKFSASKPSAVPQPHPFVSWKLLLLTVHCSGFPPFGWRGIPDLFQTLVPFFQTRYYKQNINDLQQIWQLF